MKETENFLDSYALIEIIKGNPNYERYTENIAVSSKTNLVEVAYHLAQDFPEDKAIKIISALKILLIEIEEKQVTKIAYFRKKHSKNKFSYIDCIGYVLAL